MQHDQDDSDNAERFCKPKVGGSIPSAGTTETLEYKMFSDSWGGPTRRSKRNGQRTADAQDPAQWWMGDGEFTYFVRAGDAIKIGRSARPTWRISELQVGCPEQLEKLAVVPSYIIEESEAHERFSHLRMRAEWFLAAPELLEFIEGLNAMQQPIPEKQTAAASEPQPVAASKSPARPDPEMRAALLPVRKSLVARASETTDQGERQRCLNLIANIDILNRWPDDEACRVQFAKNTTDLERYKAGRV